MAKKSSLTALAERYAGALFGLAEEQKSLDKTSEELQALVRAYQASGEWRRVAGSPAVARKDKVAAMEALAKKISLSDVMRRFLLLLAEQGRLDVLPAAACAFQAKLHAARGIISAELVSAHPMDSGQQDKIKAALDSATGKSVELHLSENPALIGGLQLRLGSTMIDASVAHQLSVLGRQLKQAAA